MNKLAFVLFAVMVSFSANAQQIRLRPSLGNGKPFTSYQEFYTNVTYGDAKEDSPPIFRKREQISHRVIESPQAGLMLEYTLNSKSTIGLGMMAGRTELQSGIYFNNFRKSYSGVGSNIKKIGLEYTHQFGPTVSLNKTRELFFAYNAGAFLVSHRHVNYECCNVTFTLLDSLNYTTDSSTSREKILNNNGFIMSVGLRVGFYNKQKNREGLSVTFLYDQGFIPLWETKHFAATNYIQDEVMHTMQTKGSQFKIYLSLPINIYNTESRKFSWQKNKD